MIRIPALVLLAALGTPSAARATYSIAAIDAATGEVGGAGTSCVGSLDVAVIYGAVPGVGVVHAQARLSERGRDQAVTWLADGQSPRQVIDGLTQRGFDRNFETRQYGVVTSTGAVAAFTGTDNGNWAGHRTGALPPFTFSVQGNLLTGPPVIEQAFAGFEAGGCDLADRLMRALEAGRDNGEGDARCTPRGVPADAAFIRVNPTAGPASLALSVRDTGNRDPVTLLRAEYDAWRADNPCPPPPDAGVEPDAGAPDADPPDIATPEADPPDAAQPDGGEVADAANGPTLDAGADGRVRGSIGSSCRCTRTTPRASAAIYLVGLLGLGFPHATRRRTSAKRPPRAPQP